MRRAGAGLVGVLAGLLVGLVVQDLPAPVLANGGVDDSLPPALLLGFLTPVLGVAGVVLAVVIEGRRAKRRSPEER